MCCSDIIDKGEGGGGGGEGRCEIWLNLKSALCDNCDWLVGWL